MEPSSEYARDTAGAKRVDLGFRFQNGKAALEGPALIALGRLVEKMDGEFKGRQILLFGFADSRGTPDANVRLSEERARTVRQEFIGRGMTPALVKGFGQSYPIASNEIDEGREKNRRVEVWLR